MSAPSKTLGSVARATAFVWIAAYLAWSDFTASSLLPRLEVPPPPEEHVPLAARPAPPLPTPPRESEPEPPPRVVAARVGASELETGEQILAGTSPFPVLSAGYASYGSFARYARAMRSLGARFVVLSEREIAAGVDLERASLEELGPLEGFSPRARSYSGEPELDRVMRLVRERYGPSASVAMLVPRKLDAGLFGGIARALEEHGQPADGVHEVVGRYEPGADGRTRLRVDAALRKDGERIPLDIIFDLDQIASVSHGSARGGGST